MEKELPCGLLLVELLAVRLLSHQRGFNTRNFVSVFLFVILVMGSCLMKEDKREKTKKKSIYKKSKINK